MAWYLAIITQLAALVLAYNVVHLSRQINGRVPDCDKRDALAIAAYGFVLAALLVVSHYIQWPKW